MTAPPLKTDPKYGYFPWWPVNGNDWVHPEDVAAARSMIPSGRIYRRDGVSGPYVVLHYGQLRLRVRRTLWCEVEPEGFEMGDWVEVCSRGLRNTPRTGTIREIVWDEQARAIRYQILEGDRPIENLYAADDLQHVDPTAPLPMMDEREHRP
jgi:hypothetical protein